MFEYFDEPIEKEFTFFQTGGKYREAIEPIADEAAARGYSTTFTDNLSQHAEIGIYSDSPPTIPEVNSKLSVISFHGVDSAYKTNSWHNWSRFDIGLLPGQKGAENWKRQSKHPAARPNIGAFPVGWPKSDPIMDTSFETTVEAYQSKNGIEDGTTVLYAPGYECHGKLEHFVEHAQGVADTLLIKHGPYDDGSYLKNCSLSELYGVYDSTDSVRVLDKTDNIIHALSVADVVVSDSLSVMLEGLLTNTIPVTVRGWKSRRGDPQSTEGYPKFIIMTDIEGLRPTLVGVFKKKHELRTQMIKVRDTHFESLGQSSKTTIDLIDSIIDNDTLPVKPITPMDTNTIRYFISSSFLQLEYAYLSARGGIKSSISDKNKDRLEKYGVGNVIESFDKLFRDYNR